jgi:histidyl-tRNA synthetase
MRDVLPPETARSRALVDAYRAVFDAAGYGEIRTPLLEELAVFLRVGEGTDVVSKEMYTFTDRDGTEVALRPETTASVARAFLQHHPIVPWKVWYVSDHFRHERPQKGRLRQHSQFGVEVIGSADPDVDVEVIVGLWDVFTSIGLRQNRLLLNSIGEPATRARFGVVLREWLDARRDQLDEADRDRVDANPMRVLDSKQPATIAATEGHPTLIEVMSDAERGRFERVQAGISAAGVVFEIEPRLVRGLDYYTHTVFEIVSDAIDASQSTIGGGGRYDGLVEAMGGDAVPGIGFGSGLERVLLACDAEAVFPAPAPSLDCFVVTFGGDGSDARDLCLELRRAGLSVDRGYDGRSSKSQMKSADRSGARLALLSGDDEREAGTVTVRDLRGDAEQVSVSRQELIDELRKRLP